MQFKTTINCQNCLRMVTAFLNELEGIDRWQVDLNHPDKILTVETRTVSAETIIETVKEAGFEINEIQDIRN